METILTSVKKQLGIAEEYTHFDPDLFIHINTVMSTLNQLGVGPEEGFIVTDEFVKWTDFLPQSNKLEFVKSYVGLKVKLIFDPPTSTAHMDALKQSIAELEWRISVAVDPT